MKKINFDKLNERNEFSLSNFLGVIEMEFIKTQRGYLVKDSGGKIVSEEEKLKLENEEMILQDFKSNNCQQETTKKIARNKKKIKELENDILAKAEYSKERLEPKATITALHNKENADDIIKETDTTI